MKEIEQMFLLVTDNSTGEVIYQRELVDNDTLSVESYLDEVSRYLEISLDPEPEEDVGAGQYNIKLAFSTNPEDVCCWESKDFFIAEEY